MADWLCFYGDLAFANPSLLPQTLVDSAESALTNLFTKSELALGN